MMKKKTMLPLTKEFRNSPHFKIVKIFLEILSLNIFLMHLFRIEIII